MEKTDLKNPQAHKSVKVSIQQPCTQEEFNTTYKYQKRRTLTLYQKIKKHYSGSRIITVIFTLFPILKWLPQYKCKTDLPSDLTAGFTVAILHIPQGMAYGSLGSVNPIVGIFMAIFPIFVYFLMGTSRHISMGSFSVVCLMAGKPVAKYSTNDTVDNDKSSANNTSASNKTYTALEVASVVSFTVGIIQVFLGFCKAGSLSMFLSAPLISGFITGAAVTVFVSQLQHVFGIKLPTHILIANFNVINTLYYLCKNISKTNFIALGLCLATITVLYLYTAFVQQRLKKYQILVPMELIIMLCSTAISYFCSLEKKHSVDIVGEIPSGMISPKPPPVHLILEPYIFVNCLLIAIVSFSINISMATTFSKKEQYDIDPNQEFVASGFGNVLGGFFSCLPISTSLSRSMLQYKSGGKTQLASVFASILLLSIILYLGKFLSPLPYSVLAGIIIWCLQKMLIQIKDFPKFWKKSTSDGVIWLVTFLAVVALDIHIGLIVAFILAILSIILMNQNLIVRLLGQVPSTGIFLEIDTYQEAKPVPNFIIVQVQAGLHFANIHVAIHKIKRLVSESMLESINEVWTLVIDMSGVAFVDPTSLLEILTFFEDLKIQNVRVCLAQCSVHVYEQMKKCNFFSTFSENGLFPTIQDALKFIPKETEHKRSSTES